jgi:hypothetical protein
VRVVCPEILPVVAVMVAVPAATPVARPLLFTVAADVFEEVQVTWVVTSRVVPSEYVPEAASCLVFPTGTLGLAGVTDMEDRVAADTVRVVLPEIFPEVAVMVAVPAATPVARPLLFTVATEVSDDFQVTCVVISRVVPSEYVPEAASWLVFPGGTLGLAGVSDMEDRAAEGTVRIVLPEIKYEAAVMVVVPGAMPLARPLLFTVATDVLDDLQMTRVVITWVVPSEYVPEAVNC